MGHFFTLRALLASLLLAAGVAVCGQAGLRTVQVADSADGRPIADVAVSVDGRPQGSTDARGELQLRLSPAGHSVVRFAHIGYRAAEVPASAIPPNNAPWTVQLAARTCQLRGVVVGRTGPEEVYRRADLHAADLLVNQQGVWVLAYAHPRMVREQADAGREILRDVRLVLLDTLFRELASCPVPEEVYGLRHDLRNDAVIEGTRHAFATARTSSGLLLRPFSLDTLRQMVLPWKDSIPGLVLGTVEKEGYPQVDQVAWDPALDSMRLFCAVQDTFLMGLFRSQYKYMKGPAKVEAMYLAAALGTDKETVAAYLSGFSSNAWYRPVHAPLFVAADTVLVFDLVRQRIRKFTAALAPAGEVPVDLGGREGRALTGRLLQDRSTRTIYAEFARHGTVWLRTVDPVDGRLGPAQRLAQAWPERVQVHAGHAYYIWRPYGSLQKRTVYREALR